jgi:hypothetical protein
MHEAELVATGVLQSLNAQNWAAVVAYVDEDDLLEWFRGYAEVVEEPVPDVSAADLKRQQPEWPDAVAEYNAAELNLRRRESRGKVHGFAGIEDRSELLAIKQSEALARYLQAQDPEWRYGEMLNALDSVRRAAMQHDAPRQGRTLIGTVAESPSMAHAVYRVSWTASDPSAGDGGEVVVATLRLTNSGWRVRLRGELFEHGAWGFAVPNEPQPGTNGQVSSDARTDVV